MWNKSTTLTEIAVQRLVTKTTYPLSLSAFHPAQDTLRHLLTVLFCFVERLYVEQEIYHERNLRTSSRDLVSPRSILSCWTHIRMKPFTLF